MLTGSGESSAHGGNEPVGGSPEEATEKHQRDGTPLL